jgi:hypothetical protein
VLFARGPQAGGLPVVADWVSAVVLVVLAVALVAGIALAIRAAIRGRRATDDGPADGARRASRLLIGTIALVVIVAWLVLGFERGPKLATAGYAAAAAAPVYDVGTRTWPGIPPLFVVQIDDEVTGGATIPHTATQLFLVEPVTGWTAAISPVVNRVQACDAAGCPVYLATQAHEVATCLLLPLSGVLVRDDTYGLGLRHSDGSVAGALWPFGWSARRDSDGVVLLDSAGDVVAREGEEVTFDGNRLEDHDVVCAR